MLILHQTNGLWGTLQNVESVLENQTNSSADNYKVIMKLMSIN